MAKTYISKVKLPSGNTYYIKDEEAREILAAGMSFVIAWDGASTPVPANIPAGVVVNYEGTNYTGTLAASSGTPNTFYLIKERNNVYSEYVRVRTGEEGSYTYSWERLGDTSLDLSDLGELAYKDEVKIIKGSGASVLGASTTFTAPASAVTFSGGTTDKVLGSDATFTTTVTPTTTNIKATASGAAVGANGTANAITGFGAHTTDTFVKSVSAETNKKLVVTSITPTNGTESVSKVTKTTSKLVTTTIPNVTGNTNVSIPNVTGNTTVTANKSTWTFSMGSGADAETLIIGGGNGSDVTATNTTLGTALSASKVTLGTAITAATGAVSNSGTGSDVVTAVTISDKTVAKVGTAVTVATGETATDGEGDAIVTGVTIGTSAAAITALGTPTTSACLTGVKVTSQPTITLATGATAGTGVISVATGITSASTTTNNKDEVTAVTNIGSGTTSSKAVTVGTNDRITAVKHGDLTGGDGATVVNSAG